MITSAFPKYNTVVRLFSKFLHTLIDKEADARRSNWVTTHLILLVTTHLILLSFFLSFFYIDFWTTFKKNRTTGGEKKEEICKQKRLEKKTIKPKG